MTIFDIIAQKLYQRNYKTAGGQLHSFENFIEARNLESEYRGGSFYIYLIQALYRAKKNINNEAMNNVFNEAFPFCKSKAVEYACKNFQNLAFDSLSKFNSTTAKLSLLEKMIKDVEQHIQNSTVNDIETLENFVTIIDFEIATQHLDYLLLMKSDLAPSESQTEIPNDKLSLKQQILLLKQIGFFDLIALQNLSTKDKGLLVSTLLNRTEKTTLEIIRGLNGKPADKYSLYKDKSNGETVNNILKVLGLNEYKVTSK